MNYDTNSEYVMEQAGRGLITELFPSDFIYHRFYSLNAYTIATSYIQIQLNSTGDNKKRNLDTFRNVIQGIPRVQHKANIYRFIMIAVVILIIWYYSTQNYPDTEKSQFRNDYYLYAVGVVGVIGFIYYKIYTDGSVQRESIDLYNNIIQKLDPILGDGKDKQLIYKNLDDAIGPMSYFTSNGIFIGNFPLGINVNNSKLNPAVKTGVETAVVVNALANIFGNNSNSNNRIRYF